MRGSAGCLPSGQWSDKLADVAERLELSGGDAEAHATSAGSSLAWTLISLPSWVNATYS
jgi:hypothetical protein